MTDPLTTAREALEKKVREKLKAISFAKWAADTASEMVMEWIDQYVALSAASPPPVVEGEEGVRKALEAAGLALTERADRLKWEAEAMEQGPLKALALSDWQEAQKDVDRAEAVLAALSRGEAAGDQGARAVPCAGAWLPIETAPRDGTNVLCCVAGVPRSTGEAFWWQSEGGPGGWQTWDGENHRRTVYNPRPTHWMPLPAPPSADEPSASGHETARHSTSTPHPSAGAPSREALAVLANKLTRLAEDASSGQLESGELDFIDAVTSAADAIRALYATPPAQEEGAAQ